jgi:hypothetical protein
MPLDSNKEKEKVPLDSSLKIAHILSVILRTFTGRQKTVVLVYQSAGIYSYATVQAIFRPQTIIDLQIPDQVGSTPRQQFDLLMVVPVGTNLVGVVYVADTTIATAPGVATATKYAIVEALPVGILPGGTHIVAKMRRLR